MVARGYYGLGSHDAAVAAFDRLKPYVEELLGLQGECEPMKADYSAIGIALDGLQTAAYHFTRRRHFYHELESQRSSYRPGNNRLSDRQGAIAAFEALTPYANALGKMQGGCRPFGRDYLARGAGPASAMSWRAVQAHESSTLGDHRWYPGCRVVVTCVLCGWSKG